MVKTEKGGGALGELERARRRYPRSATVFYSSFGIACAPLLVRLNAYALATWVACLPVFWAAPEPTGMRSVLANVLIVCLPW